MRQQTTQKRAKLFRARVLEKSPVRNTKITAYRVIDGQAVIVNLKKSTFNILNPTATRIWELVDGKTTIRQILAKLYQEFNNVEQNSLESDCLEFVNQMIDKGLLVLLQ